VKDGTFSSSERKCRRWGRCLQNSGVYEGQWTFNGSITQNAAKPAGTGDAFADFIAGVPFSVGRNFAADTFRRPGELLPFLCA